MNQNVDQRTVELTFDNAEFEANVAQSLLTLSDLKEATQFKDAGKGFDELAKSAKALDFTDLTHSVDQLNNRFSAFGVAGMSIIHRLTNDVMNFAGSLAYAVTSAPRDGWAEFELNTDSIKTILNSAKDANGLPVTLDLVNEKLNELNTYSDQTIYSFSDMTSNIGKFTNAGVDLESAVTAIKGVANVAALAGADANQASRAMYNFGQALGSGSVKLLDWMSIENASMATQEFKEQLIETAFDLGTLRKEGDKYISTTTGATGKTSEAFNATENFRDSLSSAWMTSEVLTKTLAKYTNELDPLGIKAKKAATEVTTLSKLFDTLKESMGSGWMQTWQLIIGDFEEAKTIWTGIYNAVDKIIGGVAKVRNDLLREWKEGGGRDAIIAGIQNLWTAVTSYAEPIKNAFKTIFPDINASGLIKVSEGFKKFTERFKPYTDAAKDAAESVTEAVEETTEKVNRFNEIVQEIIRGDWGNGQERIDRLTEAGYAFENLQNGVNEYLGCAKRYETTMSDEEAVGIKVTEATDKHTEAVEKSTEALERFAKQEDGHRALADNLTLMMLGFASTLKTVKMGISKLAELLAGPGATAASIFSEAIKYLIDFLGTVGEKLYIFNNWLQSFDSFDELFEDAKKHISEFLKKFEDLGFPMENTKKFIDKIIDALKKLKDKVGDLFKSTERASINDKLKKLLSVAKTVGKYIGGAFLLAFESVLGVASKVKDGIGDLYDKISNLSLVQKAGDYFQGIFEKLKGYWDKLKSTNTDTDKFTQFLTTVQDILKKLSEILTPIFAEAFDKFVTGLQDLNAFLENKMSAFESNGVIAQAIDLLERFKGAVEDIPATIESMKSWFSTPVAERKSLGEALPERMAGFLEKVDGILSGFSNEPTEQFGSITTNIADGIRNLNNLGDLGGFSKTTEELADSVESVNKFEKIPEMLKRFADGLSKIDWMSGALLAFVGSMTLFVFRWSKVGKNLATTIKAMGAFITKGSYVATAAMDKYTGFLKIASAVALIAGAIWLVAQVPAEEFKRSVKTLLGAFLIMAVTIGVITKFKVSADAMKGLGAAFAGMAAAMLIIAIAIKAFTMIEWDEVKQSALKMVIFMGMLALAARIAGKSGVGAAASFLSMSLALLILIPAIKGFAALDTTTLIKGGGAVVAFMGLMAVASWIARKSNAFFSFLGMSLALLLLIPSLKIIGGMEWEAVIKGGGAIVAFMISMGLAALCAHGVSAKPFLGIAVVIGVIAVSLYKLAEMPWSSLLAASYSLKKVINAVTKALFVMGTIPDDKWDSIYASCGVLALILLELVVAFLIINEYMKPSEVLAISTSLTLMMVGIRILAPAINVLSEIKFEDGVRAAGNLLVFLGVLVIALGALGEISEMFGGAFAEKIRKGSEFLGEIFGYFIKGIGNAFSSLRNTQEDVEAAEPVADKMTSFADKIQGFIDMVQQLPDGIAERALTLAKAILAFTAAEFVDAIAGWIVGEEDVGKFAEGVEALVGTMVEVGKTANGAEIDEGKLDAVIRATEKMIQLTEAIPETGGFVQRITGIHDLSDFALEMETFMDGGFRGFMSSLRLQEDNLNEESLELVDFVKDISMKFVELAKAIPAKGGLKQAIEGSSDLGDFAKQMKTFLDGGYRGFASSLRLLGDPDTGLLEKLDQEVIPATEKMIALGSKIKMNSAIVEFIIGSNDLGKFGEKLSKLGTGIKALAEETAGISISKIDWIVTEVGKFAELNSSESIKGINLTFFGDQIKNLGTALYNFDVITADVGFDQLSTQADSVMDLSKAMGSMSGVDYSGAPGFCESLNKLAEAGAKDFASEFSGSAKVVSAAVAEFVQAGVDTITRATKDFIPPGIDAVEKYTENFTNKVGEGKARKAGQTIAETAAKGVESKNSMFVNAGKEQASKYSGGIAENAYLSEGSARAMAADAKSAADDYTGDYYDMGRYVAEGYASGVDDFSWKASNAVANMVEDAYAAGMAAQRSSSPSKKYKEMGKYAIEGYALGFIQNIKMVVNAAEETAYAGIDTMTDAINKAMELAEFDTDIAPTITPVVDMSNVNSAVRDTASLFDSVEERSLAAAFSIANEHNEALNQNRKISSVSYSGELSELIENTSKLINAVKQNRYAHIDGNEVFTYVDRRMGMA